MSSKLCGFGARDGKGTREPRQVTLGGPAGGPAFRSSRWSQWKRVFLATAESTGHSRRSCGMVLVALATGSSGAILPSLPGVPESPHVNSSFMTAA